MTEPWTPPDVWPVPREWSADERCFILCGGPSLKKQRDLVPRLKGRVIAVKHGVLLRPDADVLFLTGEFLPQIAPPLLERFTGTHRIVRGKHNPLLPQDLKRVGRVKDHEHLCEIPTHVCGLDGGTSAINLAYHFGAREIILLGYDMTGTRWLEGEWLARHPLPRIPQAHFDRHMRPLPALARDCEAKGVKVINCSPISAVTCFERRDLKEFL